MYIVFLLTKTDFQSKTGIRTTEEGKAASDNSSIHVAQNANKKTTEQKNQIFGRITYPKVFPELLPTGSCLVVNLFDTNVKPARLITQELIKEPVPTVNTEYKLNLPITEDVTNLKLFKLSALVTLGWCAEKQAISEDPSKTAKPQDYFSIPVELGTSQNVEQDFRGPDIQLKQGMP